MCKSPDVPLQAELLAVTIQLRTSQPSILAVLHGWNINSSWAHITYSGVATAGDMRDASSVRPTVSPKQEHFSSPVSLFWRPVSRTPISKTQTH